MKILFSTKSINQEIVHNFSRLIDWLVNQLFYQIQNQSKPTSVKFAYMLEGHVAAAGEWCRKIVFKSDRENVRQQWFLWWNKADKEERESKRERGRVVKHLRPIEHNLREDCGCKCAEEKYALHWMGKENSGKKEKRENNHIVLMVGMMMMEKKMEVFCEGARRREDGGSSSSKSGRRTTVS